MFKSRKLTKQDLRSKILLRLKSQKEDTKNRKSGVIKKKLLQDNVFKKAKNVMFYIALKDEVNTQGMIREAKKLGKTVTVPVCRSNRVSLRPAILDYHARLRKGPYGLSEPVEEIPVRLSDLDLVIVPGLAFDKSGRRLGRGKGYYDRFLKRIPKDTPTIGLAFDFQIFPRVPTLKHDINVHKIIFA